MRLNPPIVISVILAGVLIVPSGLRHWKEQRQIAWMMKYQKAMYEDRQRITNSPQNKTDCRPLPESTFFAVRFKSKEDSPPSNMEFLIDHIGKIYERKLRIKYKEKVNVNYSKFCENIDKFGEIDTVLLYYEGGITVNLAYGNHLRAYCGVGEKNYDTGPLPIGRPGIDVVSKGNDGLVLDPIKITRNLENQARWYGADGVCFDADEEGVR